MDCRATLAGLLLAFTATAQAAEVVFTQQVTTAKPGVIRALPARPVYVQPAPGAVFGVAPAQQPSAPPRQPAAAPRVQSEPQQPVRPSVTITTPTAGGMKIHFDNAPLHAFINAVMQQLGYNYVTDAAAAGTVNVYTSREVSNQELFAILESVLRLNNLTITKSDNIYLIVPEAKAAGSPHKVVIFR